MSSVSDISTLVTAAATVVYTIGTFLLWGATRRTLVAVQEQVRNQTATSHSSAQHEVLNAHRDLFLQIMGNEQLLKVFSAELGMTTDQARSKFIATLLINQARRIFIDYNHRLSSGHSIESFDSDAKELFALPFIRERWNEVKQFHPQAFRNYVEAKLI